MIDSTHPHYAYGVMQAAAEARALGIGEIAALELGVAGGNGLLALEEIAWRIGESFGVGIRVYGFDTGCGMPAPMDYRDMPYLWCEGDYAMDQAALRRRLTDAELILGDVSDTLPEFLKGAPGTIGFISFDLDYYSSTIVAMKELLTWRSSFYLPRVFCYFDDTVGQHDEFHSEWTGELLAIREFNEFSERKMAKINGIGYKLRPITDPWLDGVYCFHVFDHPLYTKPLRDADKQLPLEERDG